MESNATAIEALIGKAEDYGKTTIELVRLKAIDKSAEVASFLAVRFVIFMAVALFMLIINIGLALWIGDLLGKSYYGFFVIAGVNAIFASLLYSFRRKWIAAPLTESVISQLMKQKAL